MNGPEAKRLIRALERIGLVLGGVMAAQMSKAKQAEKIQALKRCGFANSEIANLLGMAPSAVGVALHRARKRGKKTAKKPKL